MTALTIGSLFAGYGGLDLATEAALDARTAWVSDIDPGACKVLAHRFPHAPNHGDITRIDWASVEPVDIITGGSPCQDLSTAGRRAGMTDGTRSNLWVQMREAIAHVQPTFVLWENVRGALSAAAASEMESDPRLLGDHPAGQPALRALGRVLGDLADLGFDAEWRGVRASDVGACHQRFRIFVLAWRRDAAAPLAHRGGGIETLEHYGRGAEEAHGAGVSHQPDRDTLRAGPNGGLAMLPTPSANLGDNGGPQHPDKRRAGGHSVTIEDAIHGLAMLPTPRATDGTKGGPNQRGSSGDLMLPSAVAQLPTPRATRGGSSTETAAMLPTPRAEERMQHNSRDNYVALSAVDFGQDAVAQLLPTPRVTQAGYANDGRGGRSLDVEARMLPTPKAGDAQFDLPRTSGRPPEKSTHLATRLHYTDFGQYADAIARQEAAFGYPAPSPTEPGKNRPRLSAEFASWMMGLPPGWITDVPGVTRNEALRMAGNGVVPAQAAAALRDMLPHALAALAERQAA